MDFEPLIVNLSKPSSDLHCYRTRAREEQLCGGGGSILSVKNV